MMTLCPLCLNRSSFSQINGPDKRMFLCCDRCKLVFTTTSFMPSRKEVEKRSKQDKNGILNPVYLKLLAQGLESTLPFLSKGSRGLDYGCGQTPTLSDLLEQQDIRCENYDPLFFTQLPEGPFDFIFAVDCFQHFFLPARELQEIKSLLKPGGHLIVITEKWTKPEVFSRWTYGKDQSNVTFYHTDTFRYISEKYKFTMLENSHPKIIIMQKEEIEAEVGDAAE